MPKVIKTPFVIMKQRSSEASNTERCKECFKERNGGQKLCLAQNSRYLYKKQFNEERWRQIGRMGGKGQVAKETDCHLCFKPSHKSVNLDALKNSNDGNKGSKIKKTPIFVPKKASRNKSKGDGSTQCLTECNVTEESCLTKGEDTSRDFCNEEMTRKDRRAAIRKTGGSETQLRCSVCCKNYLNFHGVVSLKNRCSGRNVHKVLRTPIFLVKLGSRKSSNRYGAKDMLMDCNGNGGLCPTQDLHKSQDMSNKERAIESD